MEIPYYNSILDRFFDVLGLSPTSSFKELKSRYHELAFIYHPDKNDSIESLEKMKEINEAYSILKSNKSRIEYVKKYGVCTTNDMFIEGKTYKEVELESIKQSLRDIKKSYQDAYQYYKKESFKQSVKENYNRIDEEDYFGSLNTKFLAEGLKITCAVGLSLLYQLNKLRKEKNDTVPRYTTRNRKTLAGILVAAMLFNPLALNGENEDPVIPEVTYEESIPQYLVEDIPLVKIHTVQPTETLSSIAKKYNITVEQLMKVNNIKYDNIRQNNILKIPYYIDDEEVSKYTISVNSKDYKSLEDIAEKYGTDLKSIYSLNIECFELIDGKYYQISDEILVPDFEKITNSLHQKTYSKS